MIKDWTDCYLSSRKKTGFVCTLQLPEKFQRFWGLNDIQKMLSYAQDQNKSNVYLSLNAFKYGSRQETSLMQIRNLGVDLDIYKVGASIEEAIDEIQVMIMDDTLPEPNLFVQSGRGLQLIYGIEGGAAPKISWLSRYITSQYIAKLAFLGADTRTTDPTRVLRFPNTINQKNQIKATVEIWNPVEYTLQELYRYVTPIEEIRKTRRKKKQGVVIFPPPKGVVDLYSLNTKKKDDLELLVQLRQSKMTGYRNTFLYSYSFTIALIVKTQAATIVFARQINEKFTEPLLKKEVDVTAKSAYDDATKFLKAFAENNYRMRGLASDLVKPEKSSTIIEKLNITEEESSPN
ncbi:AsnC family protein [Thermoflavimicrobium daqui]|uniref:Replication protein n=1 Tax=Thermoflavimicrobium daqui TaxID=2137476 RepID=A0A364K1P8_9BACL|nr:AsnC family protein [Thermoflavimicrobium daqui]RAL21958.1 replication protein [Thermoflavimicrobium daqui]